MTPQVLGVLEDRIEAIKRPHPVRVAIDGPDAAGKTTLADELAAVIVSRGRKIIRASIDGFHRPKKDRYARCGDTVEAFYRDSFDHEVLRSRLLLPLGPGGDGEYRVSVFDYRSDSPKIAPEQKAGTDSILLFDGIFLFRPELADCWDFRIFLQVDFQEAVRRAMERDLMLFGTSEQVRERYERKYIPGQKIYFDEVDPLSVADIVIDNNDVERPFIVQ